MNYSRCPTPSTNPVGRIITYATGNDLPTITEENNSIVLNFGSASDAGMCTPIMHFNTCIDSPKDFSWSYPDNKEGTIASLAVTFTIPLVDTLLYSGRLQFVAQVFVNRIVDSPLQYVYMPGASASIQGSFPVNSGGNSYSVNATNINHKLHLGDRISVVVFVINDTPNIPICTPIPLSVSAGLLIY